MYERIWANWQDFVEKLDIYPMIRPYLETSQITIHEVPAKTCISNAADEGYRIVYILQGSAKVVSLTYRGIRMLLDEIGVGSFSVISAVCVVIASMPISLRKHPVFIWNFQTSFFVI